MTVRFHPYPHVTVRTASAKEATAMRRALVAIATLTIATVLSIAAILVNPPSADAAPTSASVAVDVPADDGDERPCMTFKEFMRGSHQHWTRDRWEAYTETEGRDMRVRGNAMLEYVDRSEQDDVRIYTYPSCGAGVDRAVLVFWITAPNGKVGVFYGGQYATQDD